MLVAQITDTHIRPPGRLAYGTVDTTPFLERLVAHLRSLEPRPDAVIVTGDLTDFDTPEEYGRFREIVDPLGLPLFPIPGNHDSSAGLRRAFPEIRPRLSREDICYAVEDFPLRLVLLDSTVPGAPHGRLGPERLLWLDRTLAKAPRRPTLIALHHPPFAVGIRHMDVQNCLDGSAVAEIVAGHRQVVRVVCGHVHRAIVTTFAGVAASIGPAPAHAVSLALDPDGPPTFHLEPPSIHLHQFSPSSGMLVTHQSFIGTYPGPYPFFGPDGSLIEA